MKVNIKEESDTLIKSVKSKITIEEVGNRDTLFEGRSFGMGFAFVKKVGPNEYKAVQPLSACKDYLNDIVFTEHTKKSVRCFGLTTTFNDLLSDPYGYMVIKILPYGNKKNTPYDCYSRTMDGDIKLLNKTYKNIQKFVNLTNTNHKIVITKADNNKFLVKFNKEWMQNNYCISMLSFLLRVALFWDGVQDIRTYLEDINKLSYPENQKHVNGPEQRITGKCIKILDKIKQDQSFKCLTDFDMTTDSYLQQYPTAVHGMGIVEMVLK
jgi:hypothetical protein